MQSIKLYPELLGYQITKQIYAGSRTLVYQATRESNQQPVVLKFLRNPTPGFSESIQFRNQFTITKNLNLPGIIQSYSLEISGNSYVIVMEDFGGVSLAQFVQQQPLDISTFLAIALQLTDILQELYHHQIVHKDIKPSNILIHPQTKQVKLIDFSIASVLPKETPEVKNPQKLEGTLAYLAPEQTGRMNRGIDYRSDFYALGVTFFELLTGQIPFPSEDPMNLVYCHIAKQPPPVHQLNPDIPPVLSAIVGKLMAKNAEDRYQSALGLKHDLELCLTQLEETGTIEAFSLGQQDLGERFLVSERLYSREAEVEELLNAFNRVSMGSTELMLVAGFSGIGKTAVVNEVHKPIVRQRGYFIKGKYDQLQRHIPFSAFVQAFGDLIGQLLTESDAQLAVWKTKILEALGDNGQAIVEVIPELEQIIGKQPAVPKLSGNAAQNRFKLLFQKFIHVFTAPEHPLVIFLDDLQWADSASFQLIQLLIHEVGHLLILGAYRDNEVSPVHPLILIIQELQQTGARVNTITLQPLSHDDINQLIADSLNCDRPLAQPLTDLVYQKTQGNPFFTTQFLKALYEDGFIQFIPPQYGERRGGWQCDISQIKAQSLTDDVVEFMAQQLQKLPPATQDVLKLAACIGAQFDLQTLAIVAKQSEAAIASALWKALQERFIVPLNETYKFFQDETGDANSLQTLAVPYRFLHDRIQQAAYSLIPQEHKQVNHYHIGNLLLANLSIAEQEKQLFEIVSQLNCGIPLITESIEQQRLAQLNLKAGRKAKDATAYSAAIHYFQTGIRLLAAKGWQTSSELTRHLHEEAAEAALLNGEFESMETWIQTVLQRTTSLLDKMKVYEVKLQAYQVQGQQLQAIALGRAVLQQLGITIPESATPSEIQQQVETTLSTLGDRKIEDLLNLPSMTDAQALAALRMLANLVPSVHQAAPYLFPLLACEEVNLSLRYGNAPLSAPGYADFGIVVSTAFNRPEIGYQFGQLALKLLDLLPAQSIQSMTSFKVAAFIQWQQEPVKQAIALLQNSYIAGLETGDSIHGPISMVFKLLYTYLSGGEILEELCEKIRVYGSDFAAVSSFVGWSKIIGQTIINLTEIQTQPELLVGEFCDEEILLNTLLNSNDELAIHLFFLNKLTLSYWFHDLPAALENADRGAQYLKGGAGMFSVPVFYYYDALARLAACSSNSNSQQQQLLLQADASNTKLKTWAKFAPMNFLHKSDLVEAERQRVLGNKTEAIESYDRAIAGAKQQGYLQDEALANELAAKFYLAWGKEKVAAGYLQEAYYCYTHWGAKAKIHDLEQHYFHLIQPILQPQPLTCNLFETLASFTSFKTTHIASTISGITDALDFITALKATQILSSKIQLKELIHSLTQIILENSGAETCVLILPQEENWQIQAIATMRTTATAPDVLLLTEALEGSSKVPCKLIQYVKHTLEPAIVGDGKTNLKIEDDYILQHQPQSLLCSPIVNQGNLVGILYLEHRSTKSVFTDRCLLILNFLFTQAATALENAKLYAALQSNEARFQKLANNIPGLIYQIRISPDGSSSMPYVSSGCQSLYEVSAADLMSGKCSLRDFEYPEDRAELMQAVIESAQNLTPFQHEWRIITATGKLKWVKAASQPELWEDGQMVWDGMLIDISDRKHTETQLQQKKQEVEQTLKELKQAQLQIIQSEKMSSLGQMVAGVAHEINNPVNFIHGNLCHIAEYTENLLKLIALYQQHYPQPVPEIQDEIAAMDLAFMIEDLTKVLQSMHVGTNRIREIVLSLRNFSRLDESEIKYVDIHTGIDSTLTILQNRLKAKPGHCGIQVVKEYGNLPAIECYAGQLNQVFMNILSNAIDALEEQDKQRSPEEIAANPSIISIRTEVTTTNQVKIYIADNGPGMDELIHQRLFDPFFTTKPVGKGTGLGLSISYQIITKQHGGSLECISSPGKGTEFAIAIPLKQK